MLQFGEWAITTKAYGRQFTWYKNFHKNTLEDGFLALDFSTSSLQK